MSPRNLIDQATEFVKTKFETELPSSFYYHNFEHTTNVVHSSELLAKDAQLNEYDTEQLVLAALFHDTGFIIDPDNHEAASSKIAKDFLSQNNYPEEAIDQIIQMILATKMGVKAKNKLEQLLQDADLSGLASKKYPTRCEKLRKELNARFNKNLKKKDWNVENINFLSGHQYKTSEAKALYNEGLKENIERLKEMEPKKNKKPKLLTIGSSKSAQTQLKTALRNHIDLSSIADNKANIMLSVNAIVITVGLPLILEKISEDPNLIIPLIILAAASLGSMVFATLSTRPAKMYGETTSEQIQAKKSNLFFFGNFYNMTFEEYEDGMRTVVGDNEILDNSITRDLFYLGKSLGNKFEYLRWCYNIFMYGIVAAIISYMVIVSIGCFGN